MAGLAAALVQTSNASEASPNGRPGSYLLRVPPSSGPAGPQRWFVSDEPHRFGYGWISGTIGAVLGLAAFCAAACLAWPNVFTTPWLGAHVPTQLPIAIAAAALLAIACAGVSAWLRHKKTLAVLAAGSGLLAAIVLALAPETAPSTSPRRGLGLDVFVLQLLAYSAVFVPIERLWPRRPEQPTFRPEWWTDFAWFVSSALAVQLTTFLVLTPGTALSAWTPPTFTQAIRTLPWLVQFAAVVVTADLVQYHVHRLCHRVPWLWRIHSVHHSATAMDWLAGSRLHVLDALLTRASVFAAIALCGFDPPVIGAYLVFVAAQATFVHANVAWRLRWLEPWLVTPRFHHWHHAADAAFVDRNYAVHLPWLDRIFGTWNLPATEWPSAYGLVGSRGAQGFWAQLVLRSEPAAKAK